MSVGQCNIMLMVTLILFTIIYSSRVQRRNYQSPRDDSTIDPFEYMRPVDLSITLEPTEKPTPTPILNTIPTLINNIFMDDFLCLQYEGWSNCNLVSNKYHGPIYNNQMDISRKFECSNQYSLASMIQISFSIAWDCHTRFMDEIQLFINNELKAHFNPFPIDDILIDEHLLLISSNCNQWFIRHITHTLQIQINQPFVIKFASLLASNIENNNVVIYDIMVQCVTTPPIYYTDRLHIDIHNELDCERYLKGDGIITNVTTVKNKFIMFKIPTNSDSTLSVNTNYGAWTFFFSANNKIIYFETKEYSYGTYRNGMNFYEMFWISWLNDNFMIGIGNVVNDIHDVIIIYHPIYSIDNLQFKYAKYNGLSWIFYEYIDSNYCQLDIQSMDAIHNNEHLINISDNNIHFVDNNLWENNGYLMFEVHCMDTVNIKLQINETTNEALNIIFQSNECSNNVSSKPILITKEISNEMTEVLYCTQHSNYDLLYTNWTWYIWWDNNQILFGNGKQIGNRIIYAYEDLFTKPNFVSNIQISSLTYSEWVFYTDFESIISTGTGSTSTTTDTTEFINRDLHLFCKRFYIHSNSKSQIQTLNTIINDDFLAFSLKSLIEIDDTPQLYLSYWNTVRKINTNDNIDFNIDNHWWWSIEFEISKQQIYLKNNSDGEMSSNILPLKFRIKDDETNCELDLTFGAMITDYNRCCYDHGLYSQEMDLFWNCDGTGQIWHYNYKTQKIYHKELNLYLMFGQRGYGFMIGHNDRNAKVSPHFPYDINVNIDKSIDNKYKISFIDTDNKYYGDLCQLSRADIQNIYKTVDGNTLAYGYEAKFNCEGYGTNMKFLIPSISANKMNDWTDIWITSFNNNIQIGIGNLIGNENDIIFSFDYNNVNLNDDDKLQYLWIDSYHPSNWLFYDYNTSDTCDSQIINQYKISSHELPHNIKYNLIRMTEKYIHKSLWNNHYLIFNISTFGEAWIQFEMKTDNTYIVEYGKDSIKNYCDDTRGITDHIAVMKNQEYVYCSKYSGYDTRLSYIFWLYWNENKLLIGNGPYLGQSVIKVYEQFSNHKDIQSVSIGSNNHAAIWNFYTSQINLTLQNDVFAPNDILIFTLNYDINTMIFKNTANVSIISKQLNINRLLSIDFKNDYNGKIYKINIPNYKYITMHKTFDSLYQININSTDLLFTKSTFFIKRKKFMNLSINFVSHIIIGDKIKILKYETNTNKQITQNTSSIVLKCKSLNINALLLINYAIRSCLICVNQTCHSCYEGIMPYIETQIMNTTTHTLYLYSNDTILSTTQAIIYTSPCGIGFGLNNATQCNLCPDNYFNLLSSDNQCHKCSNNNYKCEGSSNILIDYNAWIMVSGYSPSWKYMFQTTANAKTTQSDDSTIISSICPPFLCCQLFNGCYYDTNVEQLCANNREYNALLCGECKSGYSEIYGSTACKVCNNNYMYLFIALFVGLLYGIVISLMTKYFDDLFENEMETDKDSKDIITIRKQMEGFNYIELMINDYILALLISLLRSLTYFYQSMAYIVYNYNNANNIYWISIILQIFSIDLSVNSSNENHGFCFVSGLTALSKEIWLLFIPFAIFVSIGIIYLFSIQCGGSIYLLQKFKIKYSPNFLLIFWNVLLLCNTTIINRLLKLLSCKRIADSSFIHFYAPKHQCFDSVWFLSLFGIIVFVIFWIVIWYNIYNIPNNERQKESSLYHKCIISPYKESCWYWEFIITIRRFIISFFITFKYISNYYFTLILSIILIIYFVFHVKHKPFKHKRINNMESLCLSLLIICLGLYLIQVKENLNVFLIIFILLPFILYITRIYSFIKLFCSIKYSNTNHLNTNQQRKLFKIVNRLPFKQQMLIKSIIKKTMPHIKMPETTDDEENEKNETCNMKMPETDNEEKEEFLSTITSDDENEDIDTDTIDDEITSGNTSNIIMYFHNNSPGAPIPIYPPYLNIPQITNDASQSGIQSDNDKSISGITSYRPHTGRSNTRSNNITNIHRYKAAGEIINGELFTPTPTENIPPAFAFNNNNNNRYVQTSQNLMDYHKYIHKIEKSTGTEYSTTECLNELSILQQTNKYKKNNVEIDDEKYPLDGPNIIHQNPISFNNQISDIISIIDNDENDIANDFEYT